MYKVSIPYEDFDGNNREQDLYFNLTKTEIVNANLSDYSLEDKLRALAKDKNIPSLSKVLNDIIGMAYGIKSDDGKVFMKSDKIREEFEHSAVYDAFYLDLLSSPEKALAFLKGILPKEIAEGIATNPEFIALSSNIN